MLKIGVVGGPCSWKSAIIRNLVNYLGARGINGKPVSVEHDEEYARRYLREFGPLECEFEQFFLQQKTVEKERYMEQSACDIVICESPPFVSYIYAVQYPGAHENSKRIKALQEILITALETKDAYDAVLFSAPAPPRPDGIRFNLADIEVLARQIKGFMDCHKIPYVILDEDTPEARAEKAYSIIVELFNKQGRS